MMCSTLSSLTSLPPHFCEIHGLPVVKLTTLVEQVRMVTTQFLGMIKVV